MESSTNWTVCFNFIFSCTNPLSLFSLPTDVQVDVHVWTIQQFKKIYLKFWINSHLHLSLLKFFTGDYQEKITYVFLDWHNGFFVRSLSVTIAFVAVGTIVINLIDFLLFLFIIITLIVTCIVILTSTITAAVFFSEPSSPS